MDCSLLGSCVHKSVLYVCISIGGGLVAKSCPTLVTPWTVACQASLSMGFSRQEYWSGLPFSPSGNLPDPGIESESSVSPGLAGGFPTTAPPEKPHHLISAEQFFQKEILF